jgi:hypothetical protein
MNATATTEPRFGDWMQTATGKQFWPLDPRAEEIDIEDIAHALGNLCRYGGHSRTFYSVAEHCVLMSRAVAPENAAWALLHDASEAYLVDVPRPIKPALAGYREAEERLMRAVCSRFGLPPAVPDEVKVADHQILTDERWQAMAPPPVPWSTAGTPLGVVLEFWSPARARVEFHCRALELGLTNRPLPL